MKNNVFLQQVSISWMVLLIALTATMWGGFIIKQVEQQQVKQNIFDYRIERIKNAITTRITAYQQVLYSGVGLFATCHSVNRQTWRDFVASLRLSENYPGIQGMGFSQLIQPQDKDARIKQIQAEGGFFENYTLRPAGEREQYTSIIYLEPLDLRNQQAIGYDMFSEPTRRIAMAQARDTGKAVLSGKVTLVQEIDEDVQAGFLIYVPVYRHDLPHNTVDERRKALLGYVYSPFRIKDLMKGILGAQPLGIDLHIYDGERADHLNSESLMYDEMPEVEPKNANSYKFQFKETKTISLLGHTWTIRFASVPQFNDSTKTYAANIVFLVGTFASILLFGFTRSFETKRLFQIEHELNLKLQTEIAERQKIEAALRKSEERFDLAMRGSNDGLWDWNLETDALYLSPRWKEMLGYTVDEIQNHLDEWSKRLHPDDLETVVVDVKKHLNKETVIYQNTHRLQHKDGHYVWILARGISIYNAEGKPVRMVGTHTDLTQLKQVEDELKVLNRDFIAMLENTSDFIYFKDRDSRFHFCSQTLANITGHRSWRDMIGKHDTEVFPMDTAKIYVEEELPVFLEGKPLIDRIDPYYDVQGHLGWIHTNKLPVWSDDGKTVVSIFGISRDITERKRIESELQDAKQLSDDIINGLPGIFYMLDHERRLVRWNSNFCTVTGYTDKEMFNKPALNVIAPADKKLIEQRIKEVFESGNSSVEAEIINRHGEHVPYFFTGRRTTLQDQVYLIGVGQDITERRQMEQQLWKLANTDFLTGLMSRRYFMGKLEQEFVRVHNHEVSHSCILMLDLDYFKRINDTYNHTVGDMVLKHFAALVQSNLRQIDFMGRLGGEEFAIILPDTDVGAAQQCAERLRKLVANTPVVQDNQTILITVSIGATMLQDDDSCPDTALIRADNALYYAKNSGRNRVQIALRA